MLSLPFFLFRSEIRKLIQKLAHLKYKDLELDFDKVKQQAEAIHDETIPRAAIPMRNGPFYASLEDQILGTIETAPKNLPELMRCFFLPTDLATSQ